jgi:hypothetical protein
MVFRIFVYMAYCGNFSCFLVIEKNSARVFNVHVKNLSQRGLCKKERNGKVKIAIA